MADSLLKGEAHSLKQEEIELKFAEVSQKSPEENEQKSLEAVKEDDLKSAEQSKTETVIIVKQKMPFGNDSEQELQDL